MNSRNILICPVFNEEKNLFAFYKRARESFSGDMLFIDDGSTDSSSFFLEKIRDNNTFLLTHTKQMGYGKALIDGMRYSVEHGYEKVVTIDADLQHDPFILHTFFKRLDDSDVVLGSRYISLNKYLSIPLDRLVVNRFIMQLFDLLFSFTVTDPFCGYRGYRRSFLEKSIFKEESYGFALEVLMEMIRLNVDYFEVPVEMKYIDFSRCFHNGFDDTKKRLLHYLDVIERKRRELISEDILV